MNRLLERIERRFGRSMPSNLTLWIVGLSGLAYILLLAKPELTWAFTLDSRALAEGQLWRLVTFLFLPWGGGSGAFGPLLTLVALLLLYQVGTSLEAHWGSVRFAVYYLLGALGTIAAALLFGGVTNAYLNLSLLLAFATIFPDFEILLFFILPVKMKWLGLLDGALLLWLVLTGSPAERAGVVVAMANYLLFFAGPLLGLLRGHAGLPSRTGRVAALSGRPARDRKPRVCAKCGRSEKDDPDLEFRVCDCAEKCHGKLTDYCLEHARAH